MSRTEGSTKTFGAIIGSYPLKGVIIGCGNIVFSWY
jgi:hypothetical protein